MANAHLLREQERNSLLRRADWRFLLPDLTPQMSLCFDGGLLCRATEWVSASVARAHSDLPGGSCDLAVAVDPDCSTLREAWRALRAGGACYTEWYSFTGRGPRGVRRRLEEAGFEGVSCYWPRPDPSRAATTAWLPLESSAALRFVFTERNPPRNTVRRVGRIFRRAGRLLRPRLRLAVPVCATAHKPDAPSRFGGAEDAVPRSPLEAARRRWADWGLGTADRISWLLLTGGRRSLNKAVAIGFGGAVEEPRLAVKMTRIPESISALSREAATLERLHSRPGGIRGAPRILFRAEYGEILAVGETALVGVPLSSALREQNFAELAGKGTDWLVGLAADREPCSPSVWRARLVDSVVARFEKNFGAVVDPGLLRESARIVAALPALPLVCEQRDFSPWNVLLTGEGELAVLDWESAEPEGLAGCDLIYFLTHLAFTLDRALRTGRVRESYRTMLDPASRTGSVAADCFSAYCARVGLPREALAPLRVLVWMVHSRSEYEQIAADVAGRPSPDGLRRTIFVSLWEEELRYGARRG